MTDPRFLSLNVPASRVFPIEESAEVTLRPVSFVVPHYSGLLCENFLKSPCLGDSQHELVAVDNRQSVFHPNWSAAINEGLARARRDLIVIAREDVILPESWPREMENALRALEMRDADWGWLSVRVSGDSDDSGGRVEEVTRHEGSLLVLRKAHQLRADEFLPGSFHVEDDLALRVLETGRRGYRLRIGERGVVPSQEGETWLAERECADDYFFRKWPAQRPANFSSNVLEPLNATAAERTKLFEPIVFLARGGGGSRLLSVIGADAGIFLGNSLNVSGDTLEMVRPIYKSVIEKYICAASWQAALPPQELRSGALRMLRAGGMPERWGFKLPESMLIVPAIMSAFPSARFVHLIRDPLTTCLRRTHLTARLDNRIGQIALPFAYAFHEIPAPQIFEDSPALHMAYTTRHQLLLALTALRDLPPVRRLEIRFEEMLANPAEINRRFREWLGSDLENSGQPSALERAADPQRASEPSVFYSAEIEAQVAEVLSDLRKQLGYLAP